MLKQIEKVVQNRVVRPLVGLVLSAALICSGVNDDAQTVYADSDENLPTHGLITYSLDTQVDKSSLLWHQEWPRVGYTYPAQDEILSSTRPITVAIIGEPPHKELEEHLPPRHDMGIVFSFISPDPMNPGPEAYAVFGTESHETSMGSAVSLMVPPDQSLKLLYVVTITHSRNEVSMFDPVKICDRLQKENVSAIMLAWSGDIGGVVTSCASKIPTFVAVGNSGNAVRSNAVAELPRVIGVGALNSDGAIASYSQYFGLPNPRGIASPSAVPALFNGTQSQYYSAGTSVATATALGAYTFYLGHLQDVRSNIAIEGFLASSRNNSNNAANLQAKGTPILEDAMRYVLRSRVFVTSVEK